MSINPSIGATVTTLGGTTSIEVDRILPEQEPKQFECSILKSGSEYRLQVRRGLIEFDYFRTDANGIINKDAFGVKNTDLTYGQDTDVTLCYLYAPYFNLYPENSKVSGSDILDAEYLDNGYIKLEEGEDYFVFVYKVTPDFPSGFPPLPGPSGVYERTSPQIAVMKAGEDFINAGNNSNGSGTLVAYTAKTEYWASTPMGANPLDFGAGIIPSGTSELGYIWYNPVLSFDEYGPTGQTFIQSETPPAVKISSISGISIGYRETSCIRKDIAYIKWNAGLKRFQIFQINYGPISIRQQPIGPIYFELDLSTYKWSNEGRDSCNDITDAIDGYSKTLNQLQNCSIPGFVNEKKYQKPFETA